jgi:hypothetical protein
MAVGLSAASAGAYCRTYTCQADGSCVRDDDGCPVGGSPLFWPRACISFSVQEDASPRRSITPADAESVLDIAYETWTRTKCEGDQRASIDVVKLDRVSCDQVEFNECDDNANIWVFRDSEWPYDDGGLTLAQTWVHFDTGNGEIFDADVEVNTADFEITTADDARRSQFIAIATHEIGHVLGLDHSLDWDATMYASYSRTSNISELTADDIAGLCTIYPPDRRVGRCDPDPYNGFSTACGTVSCKDGGCRATTPGYARQGLAGVALAGVGIGLIGVRRRRNRRGKRGSAS